MDELEHQFVWAFLVVLDGVLLYMIGSDGLGGDCFCCAVAGGIVGVGGMWLSMTTSMLGDAYGFISGD